MNVRSWIAVIGIAGFAGVSSAEIKVEKVTPSSPFRIFYQGEEISFEIETSGAELPATVPLVVRQIRNYYDSTIPKWNVFQGENRAMEVVAEGRAAVTKADGKTTWQFMLDAPRLGAMRVLAKVDGQEVPLADYLRVLPPNDVSPDESVFAVDMCNPKNFDQYGRAGLKVVRWETGIRYQGRSDEFDFTEEASRLEACRRNGIKAFVIIGHDAQGQWIRFPGTDRVVSYMGGRKPETQPSPRRMGEFARWCGEYAKLMKGQVRGYEFFNEPWEGGSISGASGGGAQIRRLLAAGAPVIKQVDPAAKIAAACSIMNAEDSFLPYPETMALMDVITTHTYYNWGDYGIPIAKRLGKEVWDTESWCVMTDDHGPMKSAHQVHQGYKIIEPLGSEMDITSRQHPWTSGAATYLTGQRFLDGMKPAGLAMKGRVPTVLLFEGRGRAVAFVHNISLARPGGESLDEFPGNVPFRQQEPDIANPDYQAPGTLTISAAGGLEAYDVFGNALPKNGAMIRVPVGRFGCYVTAPQLEVLKAALEAGTLEGIKPFFVKVLDFTERLAPGAKLRVALTNVYAVDQDATVTVDPGPALTLEANVAEVALGPGEEKVVEFIVKEAKPVAINRYRVAVTARGAAGETPYTEDINAAVFVHGTPTVDGDLSDWDALQPVPVYLARKAEYVDALAQYMQLPFAAMVEKDAAGYFVQAQLAWDEKYFYVAARINDPTEVRRESNAYGRRGEAYPWPNQHIYLGPPQLTGTAGDCLLLSFNTNDDHARVWDFLAKDHPLFRVYPWPDTDYEFEILPVLYNEEHDRYFAKNFGTIVDPKTKEQKPAWPGYPQSEVWRLYDPKMVYRHHAYPFNLPTQDYDQGPVVGATSVVKRDRSTWVYEVAIPWDQLGEVKPAVGERVRFSFYTRHDGGHGLEYAAGKSVSVRNLISFHPLWENFWSTDCEWGFVK